MEGPSVEWLEARQRRSQGIGRVDPVAPERRRQVLHEIDLVDLAGGDGLPGAGDRACVGG
jgi:hypothetical protein